MMSDLIIAYGCMFATSLLLGVLAATKLYPRSGQGVMLLVTLSIVGMFAFMLYAAGQLFLALIVSHSAAIVWTNMTPVLGALAAGWILRLPNIPKVRRAGMSVLVACGSLLSLFWPNLGPLLRPPPPGRELVSQSVVLQSSWATCSPAAAATLLHQEGIPISEREMIPLCLTDGSGTPSLGLYRGVKLVADSHGRRVSVPSLSVDQLLANDDWPLLLTVKLPQTGVEDSRYEDQWGWIPGMGHTVVALHRISKDELRIADPAVGIETWHRDDLEVLFHGSAIRVGEAR